MPLDPSIYNNLNQQPSPIDTVAKYAGIQNALIQSRIGMSEIPIIQQKQQQNTYDLMRQKAGIDADMYTADPKWNDPSDPTGTKKNYNAQLADAAVNAPLAVPILMARRDAYMAQGSTGTGPTGVTTTDTLQNIIAHGQGSGNAANSNQPSQQGASNSSAASVPNTNQSSANGVSPTGYATSLPAGRSEAINSSQNEVAALRSANQNVPILDAAYSKMQELEKQGAGTGTMMGAFHQILAQHNMAYPGAETDAANIQEFHKYAATLAAAMDPKNVPELNNAIAANPNIEQIGPAIHKLIPYLRSVNQGVSKRVNYYAKNGVGIGSDPDKTAEVSTEFTNQWSPRAGEYQSLPDEEKAPYVANMSPADRLALQKSIKWEKNGMPRPQQ